jgi:von Willebrand factor type A domain
MRHPSPTVMVLLLIALFPLGVSAAERVNVELILEGQHNMIILVSDGKETCQGDPCAVARSLHQAGIQVEINVVGFDVTADERQQLECIADAGGGKYFDARNTAQMKGALTSLKKQVDEKAEVKPPPAQQEKKVVKVLPPIGTISLPQFSNPSKIRVYEQQTRKEVGAFYNHYPEHRLTVPAGAYMLEFGNYFLENITVKAGEEVVLER